MTVLLPSEDPTTCDTADFDGTETSLDMVRNQMPSSIPHSFCCTDSRSPLPKRGRNCPKSAFRQSLGVNNTWYSHSHRVRFRLSHVFSSRLVWLSLGGLPQKSSKATRGNSGGLPNDHYFSSFTRTLRNSTFIFSPP